ncbi:hypothetical protein PsYK624_060120 [Phanerochaete sordida]|uniref:BTB domain-containing protein n=1 Tax=Phanerochaete sordida TaxID=48140 RepID=A0A9P3G8K9_9APHY|nr:hypothetical protein PsYK624_060120 [Phanerochaete sordida]
MPTATRGHVRAAAADDGADAPPHKRQKTESHEGGPALAEREREPERDAVLWFEDASVVLAAENKLFKVHAGVLGHHSPVFKELLSAPALAALEERLDGCPVLRTNDKGASLARLLRIIYDGVQSDWFASGVRLDFADLRRVAIVAAKYQVPAVLDEVKSRLRAFYPTASLQAWRAVVFDDESGADGSRGTLAIRTWDSIAVIGLCRLLKMPDILPVVLYECCSKVSAANLVRGVTCGDELVRLTEDGLLLCLRARDLLVAETARMSNDFIVKPQAGCTSPQSCATKLEQLRFQVINADVASSPNPLDAWIPYTAAQYDDAEKKPCALCADALMGSLEGAVEAVWRRLGEILDLPHWPPNNAGEQAGGDNGVGNAPRAS